MSDKPHKKQTGNLVGHYLHTKLANSNHTINRLSPITIYMYMNIIHELPTVNVYCIIYTVY